VPFFAGLQALNLNRPHNHLHLLILVDSTIFMVAELISTRFYNYYRPPSIPEELCPETDSRNMADEKPYLKAL
jgi:hypothetical protein